MYDRLVGDGHTVLAPPNPLRGIPYDASFTASIIDQIDGPVVLVGHSYGGAVITVAGSSDKVAGLVYVAGVAPDEGESVNDLQGRFPSLAMGPLVRPAQLADGSVEVSIDPARFHDVFCADVPDADAAFMAISQRPVSATAFDDPATAAAWRTKPSWAVFGTADYPVAPELHRFSYDRAGSTVTEVEGASHFLMLSQPDIVATRHSRGRHRKRSQPSGVTNIGVPAPVARCGVGTPFGGVAEKEDSMEFLVEFEVEVPAGTPDAEVEQHQRAESAAAAKLAEDGHLVRLWRRPLAGDGTTAIGLYRADSEAALDGLLAALPLADWLRVTVTPLEAHPNDPATASR